MPSSLSASPPSSSSASSPPPSSSARLSSTLPEFPWDRLEPAKAKAAAHPDGIVDLSIGTPVDPVDPLIRAALAGASDAPGYPLTAGSAALRAAITDWFVDTCGASAESLGVLPTIGSKELVAWLPTLLGVRPGDTVIIPTVCYPTYEVGAHLAGATVIRTDTPPISPPIDTPQLAPPTDTPPLAPPTGDTASPASPSGAVESGTSPSGDAAPGAGRVRLVWVNSPGNPSGRVLSAAELSAWVEWARANGAVLASDECYLALGWDEQPLSVLDSAVTAGDYTGILAVHSLSKRSNLAGYRAGFVGGDTSLIAELLAVRKHAGMISPAPVQDAMVAALSDETHVEAQRIRYAARRTALRNALTDAGFVIDHSSAGLYLWATRDEPCWDTVDWLAGRGILVAPGAFYGPAAERYVRVALTATDDRVAAACARLANP